MRQRPPHATTRLTPDRVVTGIRCCRELKGTSVTEPAGPGRSVEELGLAREEWTSGSAFALVQSSALALTQKLQVLRAKMGRSAEELAFVLEAEKLKA